MKKKQRSIGFIFLCLAGLALIVTDRLTAQKYEPPKPGYGVPIRFTYPIPSKGITAGTPSAVSLIIVKNPFDAPEKLSMKNEGPVWTAHYALADTGVKLLLFSFDIEDASGQVSADDANGSMYDALLYLPGGKPVRGAHAARALSYTGISNRRGENLDKALADLEKELFYYPDNLSARNLFYTVLLKRYEFSEAARTKIAADIRSTLSASPKDASVMQFAANAYRMIGDTGQADRIEKELVKINPKGDQAAQKALSEILQIQDTRSRLARLEKFRLEFPKTRMDEFLLSQIVAASIELGDPTRMTGTGDILLQNAATPAGANALAAMAGVFADKKIELDRALAYVQKALSMVRATAVSPKPDEMTETEWKEQNQRTEARYRDVLGWVSLQKGDLETARTELEKAAEGTFQAGVFYHQGVLSDRTGDTENALENLGRAVAFGGKTAEQSVRALRTLWVKAGKDSLLMREFLDEQKRWVEDENKERILSRRIDRPAPDFKLKDAIGGYVRLSSQRGNPVVLCFWAGWSKSSLLVLQDLQTLVNTRGKDVLFLTVSTDAEKSDVRTLPDKQRFFLPVLYGNGIEKEYGILGVPVVYVIDAEGDIQYENKGYRPDMIQVLSIELADVLEN